MALKIFFDTNVILDFSIRRTPHPGIFNQIFDMVNMGKVQGFVTVSIIQTCSFYMLKYLDYQRTNTLLEMIIFHFNFLNGDKKTVLTALKSDHRDIEDAIHYFIALENEMDAIVTSDKGFIKLSSPTLPVYSPTDLLRELGH